MNCHLEAKDGNDRLNLGTGAQLNKIRAVKTLPRVARELAKDEAWLHYIALGMEPEDGLILVYGAAEEIVPAFSDDGVEKLQNLMAFYRQLG